MVICHSVSVILAEILGLALQLVKSINSLHVLLDHGQPVVWLT